MLTDAELRAIEERASKATPGPWIWDDGDYVLVSLYDGPEMPEWPMDWERDGSSRMLVDPGVLTCHGYDYRDDRNDQRPQPATRTFIANARTDIPALLAEVRRLKRGEFTPEEFQALCHHRDETPGCTRADFEAGCREYQAKLFNESE